MFNDAIVIDFLKENYKEKLQDLIYKIHNGQNLVGQNGSLLLDIRTGDFSCQWHAIYTSKIIEKIRNGDLAEEEKIGLMAHMALSENPRTSLDKNGIEYTLEHNVQHNSEFIKNIYHNYFIKINKTLCNKNSDINKWYNNNKYRIGLKIIQALEKYDNIEQHHIIDVLPVILKSIGNGESEDIEVYEIELQKNIQKVLAQANIIKNYYSDVIQNNGKYLGLSSDITATCKNIEWKLKELSHTATYNMTSKVLDFLDNKKSSMSKKESDILDIITNIHKEQIKGFIHKKEVHVFDQYSSMQLFAIYIKYSNIPICFLTTRIANKELKQKEIISFIYNNKKWLPTFDINVNENVFVIDEVTFFDIGNENDLVYIDSSVIPIMNAKTNSDFIKEFIKIMQDKGVDIFFQSFIKSNEENMKKHHFMGVHSYPIIDTPFFTETKSYTINALYEEGIGPKGTAAIFVDHIYATNYETLQKKAISINNLNLNN